MKSKKQEEENEDSELQEASSAMIRIFGTTLGGILLFAIEIVQIVVIAAAIIIPVRFFLVQPFYVRGASMEPSYYDREYLLIDEISYRFAEPHRGDVIVFRYPRDTSEFFIKRIIGLPGDTVDVKGGKVIVTNEENAAGVILEEEYTDHIVTTNDTHVKLNPDEYFLLGDNRSASLDSRSFGPVKKEYIVGKVWLRGLPISEFSMFEGPVYDEIVSEQIN
ncbi:signal peptidase I [Candidatus Uhrbacteria bacterium]|jgi:signal peptidase I|nr:signal peptidase I [Candidatus Uhrbacteria bacterium]